MRNWRPAAAVMLLVVIFVASFATYEVFLAGSPATCQTAGGGGSRGQAGENRFGAVTEYTLPGPDRWPNAIAAAPDGSVWFAEQGVPGVAHLFPGNGTVVEFAWPGYPSPKPPDCSPSVNVSGIALWDGRVWAADEFGNKTVGINPADGSAVTVVTTGKAPLPYWLAVGPDGDLWLTSNNFAGQPARLGRILPNLTLGVVDLVGLGNDQPIQIDFVNSTFALLATLDQSVNSTTNECTCTGHIYSFDPGSAGGSITPLMVGGGYTLRLPTSVTYYNGSVWVAEHGASSLVGYDFATRTWTKYPTSVVPWAPVTLPLVVDSGGGSVWFNEHYANKIARFDPAAGTLTEYSESNPPPSGYQGIQNDLSIASTPAGTWFTSMTGNYIGFVNGTMNPGFRISNYDNSRATLKAGLGGTTFRFVVSGAWTSQMGVKVSDSENPQSTPELIQVVPGVSSIPPGSSFMFGVSVSAEAAVVPGTYTVAVTVSEGGVQQTAYLFITVES